MQTAKASTPLQVLDVLTRLLTIRKPRARVKALDAAALRPAAIPPSLSAELDALRRCAHAPADTEQQNMSDEHLWRAFYLACNQDDAVVRDVLANVFAEQHPYELPHAHRWWTTFYMDIPPLLDSDEDV